VSLFSMLEGEIYLGAGVVANRLVWIEWMLEWCVHAACRRLRPRLRSGFRLRLCLLCLLRLPPSSLLPRAASLGLHC